jgi:opacity protein-like surface antigen
MNIKQSFGQFKKYWILAILLFAASPALASNNNWNGFYTAFLVGDTYGTVNQRGGNWLAPDYDSHIYDMHGNGNDRSQTASISLKAGINKQLNDNFLIGLEIGNSSQNFKARSSIGKRYIDPDGNNLVADPLSVQTAIKNYQTLAGRIGYIFDDKTLLYGLIGGAVSKIKVVDTQVSGNAPDGFWFNYGTSGSDSARKVGTLIGFGVEHKLNNRLAIRLNYEYIDFGSVHSSITGHFESGPATASQYSKIHLSNASLGLSYQF